MDPDPGSFTFIFIGLLLLSAFFSGSETAFFGLDRMTLENLKSDKKGNAKRVIKLLKSPKRLLVSILICNTLVNVAAASLAALFVTDLLSDLKYGTALAFFINIVLVTFILLLFSEISPKIIAIRNAERYAKNASFFLMLLFYMLFPISFIIDKILSWFTGLFKLDESKKEWMLETTELQTLLEIGEEQGELEKEERELIHSIFEFGETTVREIMVPRTDVICVPNDVSVEELIKIVKTKGHTRIPVYKESIDEIIGVLNAKDLLTLISVNKKSMEITKLARNPIYVPESKKIDDLLRQFQSERQHLAIVVDEYGGTSGIVTLEDVIEEIVGEIRDEYDKEQPLYQQVDENTFVVNAKIDVETANEVVGLDIPIQDEYDTLGGYILELTGTVPNEKDKIEQDDFIYEMKKVEKNRIVSVKISRNDDGNDESAKDKKT